MRCDTAGTFSFVRLCMRVKDDPIYLVRNLHWIGQRGAIPVASTGHGKEGTDGATSGMRHRHWIYESILGGYRNGVREDIAAWIIQEDHGAL
jgi:hypothetical protein